MIITIMTKRNMPRKPGGKPGKPSKPGKPGNPFERPEGENWVKTRVKLEEKTDHVDL